MKKILFLAIFFLFYVANSAWAAGLVPCGGPPETGEDPCSLCYFFVMINGIIKFVMFTLVPVVAVLMLVIGGVMFFFAGAKPDMLIRARGVITSVFIGLIIIFCAWVIVNTIISKSGIVKSASVLQWYSIDCKE